jgi:hypothetical protein
MTKTVRTFLPKNRIETLARRPGGIPREKALEQAVLAVESLRDESVSAIRDGIRGIDVILSATTSSLLSDVEMLRILHCCDRIIVLAETYGYTLLCKIAMGLCDLVGQLIEIGKGDREAVYVCVRSLHLVAPPRAPLSGPEERTILTELHRVLAHYKAAGRD